MNCPEPFVKGASSALSKAISDASVTRRHALQLLAGVSAMALLEACQSSRAALTPTAVIPLIKPRATNGAELTPVLASSELAVGRNRFATGRIGTLSQSISSRLQHT